MTIQRIEELIWKITTEMEKAATYKEFEDLNMVYTALKTKWNKLTGNKLICKEIVYENAI